MLIRLHTWKTLASAAAAARRPMLREAAMATWAASASRKGSGQTSLTARRLEDDGPSKLPPPLLCRTVLVPAALPLSFWDVEGEEEEEEEDINGKKVMEWTIKETKQGRKEAKKEGEERNLRKRNKDKKVWIKTHSEGPKLIYKTSTLSPSLGLNLYRYYQIFLAVIWGNN